VVVERKTQPVGAGDTGVVPKDSSQNFLNWNRRTVHDKFLLIGVLSRVLQPYPIWGDFVILRRRTARRSVGVRIAAFLSLPSSRGIPIFLFPSFFPHSCRHTSHLGTAA
jgi:hypothetical protein